MNFKGDILLLLVFYLRPVGSHFLLLHQYGRGSLHISKFTELFHDSQQAKSCPVPR